MCRAQQALCVKGSFLEEEDPPPPPKGSGDLLSRMTPEEDMSGGLEAAEEAPGPEGQAETEGQQRKTAELLRSLRSFKRWTATAKATAKAVGDLPWVLWLLTSEPRPGDAARRGISDVAPSAGLRATLALRVAAGAGQLGVLEMLLEAGAGCGPTVTTTFSERTDDPSQGVPASADVTATDENECTALHWAADQGHAEACELLLVFGAPIDEEDDDAWTPLCLAAEEGHLKTCSILLAYGASVSIPDEDLRSPLWWAAWRKHFDLVQLLLKHRADPNQIDRWGVSPRKILNDECPTVI
ncbi:Ankyrin repeat domain-containing protein 50 [Durusdinium trenchii]|uniref:Ankyrin repeat domain-containing protein 50 n=1 Tax=Durusdinium trenchii TaxID=1381693 RepID=A0ABP0NUZ3_9DINO